MRNILGDINKNLDAYLFLFFVCCSTAIVEWAIFFCREITIPDISKESQKLIDRLREAEYLAVSSDDSDPAATALATHIANLESEVARLKDESARFQALNDGWQLLEKVRSSRLAGHMVAMTREQHAELHAGRTSDICAFNHSALGPAPMWSLDTRLTEAVHAKVATELADAMTRAAELREWRVMRTPSLTPAGKPEWSVRPAGSVLCDEWTPECMPWAEFYTVSAPSMFRAKCKAQDMRRQRLKTQGTLP